MVAEELLDFVRHGHRPVLSYARSVRCARSRLAAPKAANSAREKALLITFHSGCHCTASAKRGASLHAERFDHAVRRARFDDQTVARGGRRPASAANSRGRGPCRRARAAGRPASSITSCAGPYCISSGWVLVVAVIEEARAPRAASGAACRRRPRSFPGSRGRCPNTGMPRSTARGNERQRGGVAMRIVQRAGLARRAGVVMRLDVRGAAGEHDAVDALEDLLAADQVAPARGSAAAWRRPPRRRRGCTSRPPHETGARRSCGDRRGFR